MRHQRTIQPRPSPRRMLAKTATKATRTARSRQANKTANLAPKALAVKSGLAAVAAEAVAAGVAGRKAASPRPASLQRSRTTSALSRFLRLRKPSPICRLQAILHVAKTIRSGKRCLSRCRITSRHRTTRVRNRRYRTPPGSALPSARKPAFSSEADSRHPTFSPCIQSPRQSLSPRRLHRRKMIRAMKATSRAAPDGGRSEASRFLTKREQNPPAEKPAGFQLPQSALRQPPCDPRDSLTCLLRRARI